MRLLSIAAGIVGFAVIANGADIQAVSMRTPVRHFEAEYTYAPGTSEQAERHVSLDRRYEFLFLNSSASGMSLGFDPEATVREYLESDVQEAMRVARAQAQRTGSDYNEILQGLLENARYKTVDCRIVTRQMVEHLITDRVQVSRGADGREIHRFQNREDQLDVALIARQLSRIVISRDSAITSDDHGPHFTCLPRTVGNESAACGELRIQYNPLPAQAGVFRGQRSLVFNPALCERYSADMDFDSCELNFQIQRCGLRYTERAEGVAAGDLTARGLSDFLEANKNSAINALQEGRSLFTPAAPDASSVPANFYNDFHAPNSRSAN